MALRRTQVSAKDPCNRNFRSEASRILNSKADQELRNTPCCYLGPGSQHLHDGWDRAGLRAAMICKGTTICAIPNITAFCSYFCLRQPRHTKHLAKSQLGVADSPALHVAAGVVAGLVGTTVTAPAAWPNQTYSLSACWSYHHTMVLAMSGCVHE